MTHWFKAPRLILLTLLVLAFAGLSVHAGTATENLQQSGLMAQSSGVTLLDLIASYPEFSTLYTAVQTTRLSESLITIPYTLFAPTNEAFEALPEGQLAALLANPQALEQLLLNHLVAGAFESAELVSSGSVTTVAGMLLAVTGASDGAIDIGSVLAIEALVASNGILYVVDTILLPADAAEDDAPSSIQTADNRGL
jgi:transforming growth factor-beta-induced protein